MVDIHFILLIFKLPQLMEIVQDYCLIINITTNTTPL